MIDYHLYLTLFFGALVGLTFVAEVILSFFEGKKVEIAEGLLKTAQKWSIFCTLISFLFLVSAVYLSDH